MALRRLSQRWALCIAIGCAASIAGLFLLKGEDLEGVSGREHITMLDESGDEEIILDNVKAFQVQNDTEVVYWPEMDIPEVAAKLEAAILFSGGGSRAYTSGIGILSALTELDLMKKFRYIGGASGGGWISSAYTYHQPGKRVEDWGMTAATDMELLGECPDPETFTNESLAYIDPKSLRRSVTQKPFQILFEQLREGLDFPEAWTASVHEFYLKGAGISQPFPLDGKPNLFTYSEATAESVLERNPHLKAAGYKFDTQKPGRPFLSFDISLHGPLTHLPIDILNKSYPTMEVNPLFTGSVIIDEHTFISEDSSIEPVTQFFAGAVESYAFTSKPPSNLKYQTLPTYAQTGVITGVPLPSNPFTLSHANGIGGWAVASAIATEFGEDLNNRLGQIYDYWSPSTPTKEYTPHEEHVFGDGGLTDNWNLFQILRREEVERFVIVTASSVPLNMSYDAAERPPTEQDIDSMVSSAFGLDPQALDNSFHYRENHVFATYQFVELMDKLIDAAEQGTGILARMDCEVVDNAHYGIKGGRTVEVLFVYLGRVFEWEERLPADLREELFEPVRDTSALKPRDGDTKYPMFPNIPLFPLDMPAEQANLLANLQGWVVRNNSDMFIDFLS